MSHSDVIRAKVRRYIASGRAGKVPKLSNKAKAEIAARRRIGDAKLAKATNAARQAARGGEGGQSTMATYAGRRSDR